MWLLGLNKRGRTNTTLFDFLVANEKKSGHANDGENDFGSAHFFTSLTIIPDIETHETIKEKIA